MNKINFFKAREYVYQNARPFDLARWKYHFENGSQEEVISGLTQFQNSDGGFGHALEPDCFNPHSSPIQTWMAMVHLEELHLKDKNHPMIQNILKYLESKDGFDPVRKQWLFQIPTNNEYPHAIWWEYHPDRLSFKYNPTAYLVGFIIKYGNRHSNLYQEACTIAKEAVDFILHHDISDGDCIRCFIGLYRFLNEAAETKIIDLDALKTVIISRIQKEICLDTAKYGVEYVTMPSKFFETRQSLFIEGNEKAIQTEIDYLPRLQKVDGSFDIYWKWGTDYPEFEQAKIWWESDLTIKNMLFFQSFGDSSEFMNSFLLTTDRLVLRNFSLDDLSALFDYRNNPLCSKYQRGQENAEVELQRMIEKSKTNHFEEEGVKHFAIALRATNRIVGDLFVDLHHPTISLGFTISYLHQRKGYAFELLTELISFLHQKYPKDEFVGLVEKENEASINLLTRMGFKNEGYQSKIESYIFSLYSK